jgi:CRISPR system Cascade subunit CasA
MSFNLITEAWLPVVTQDFQLREVSLIELFGCWNSVKEVQGDNPPTTLALYRFLLAILHRAYQGPTNIDHWEEIEQDDGKKAIAYLQTHADCFDLMHPERPFMQDATIEQDAAAEIYQANVLHGNNTSTVFCHEHQWSGNSISISEASRLLLRLHWFDAGGRKTGSSISAGVIPTMDAANVLVRGKTLKEALLLNLMRYSPQDEVPSVVIGEDIPSWERSPSKPLERVPSGYIDYLTFQWRRVRLFFEGDRAVNVAFHGGDRIPKGVDASQWECGVAYNKTKKGQFTVRLNLSRSLWRDSGAFLQSSDAGKRPRIVEWVAELQDDDLAQERLTLQVLGLSVDNAKPLGWCNEDFSAPMIYLKEKSLWEVLVNAINAAEEHQQIFRSFKGSPYHALSEVLKNGDAGALAKTLDGESRYWATLDRVFPDLLFSLPDDREEDANGMIQYGLRCIPKWTKTVQNATKEAFTQSIAPIRNYEARAAGLRSLDFYLRKLRGEDVGKAKQAKKTKQSA